MSEVWEEKSIDELCVIGDGNHSSKYPKKSEMVEHGVPFIRGTNLVNGRLSHESLLFITEEKHRTLKKGHLKTGDVLFTNRGEIGKVAIVDSSFHGANLNSQIAWLRCNEELNNNYFFYYLQSGRMRQHFENVKTGAALQQFTIKMIKAVRVAYPSLPEQKRIVAILDEAFGAIERAKEIAETNLANAKELFESYLNRVFTEKGEGWEETTLGDVCATTQGVQIPKSKQYQEDGENRRRYLYISDFLHDRNLKYVDDVHPKKNVTPNDLIVVNTGNTAGTIFRGINGILSNNLFRVSFDPEKLDSTFLYYFVTSPPFVDHQKSIVRGTANPHMGHKNFKSTPFSVPEIRTQKKLASDFNLMDGQVSELKDTCNQRLAVLGELKQSILQKAFTGQLTAKSPELEAVP